jgi:Predicted solute binding protein
MSDTQQDVVIYKDGMSSAQHRFEKDLKKRLREGWRVVSVVPTKQTFNHTSHLTVIYERPIVGKQDNAISNNAPYTVDKSSIPTMNYSPFPPVPEQEPASGKLSSDTGNVPYSKGEVNAPTASYPSVPTNVNQGWSSGGLNPNPDNVHAQTSPNAPYPSYSPYQGKTSPQLPVPYSKVIFWGLLIVLLSAFTIGIYVSPALIWGILVCILIMDIKGFFSLDGLIHWQRMNNGKRIGMGCLFLFLYPIFLFIYLFRMGRRVFKGPGPVFTMRWDVPQPVKKRAKVGIIIGSVVALVFMSMELIGMSMPSTTAAMSDSTPTVTLAQKANVPGKTQLSKPTSTPTPKLTPTPTPRPTPTPKPTPTPVPFAHFDDGTYIVGKDIQPGTYRTRDASLNCYYARLSGFDGTVGDILANNNTDNPAIVTISPSDKGFQSTNCGTWTKDLSAITTSKATFGDGMYIVGTDIQPGTYKSSGQSNCYYARLSGFGNTTDDILANDNTDTPAIVTISDGDAGFQSNSCGIWTKE